MDDKVILKYFEDLNRSTIMKASEIKDCFRNMHDLNVDLIVDLHHSHAFKKALYDEWKNVYSQQKSTAKLSVDYTSGKSAVNNELSKKIDNHFKPQPAVRFDAISIETLLSLKIRLSTYLNVYNKLCKRGLLTPDQLKIYRDIEEIRNRLVRSNLKLVVSFCKSYKDKGVSFIDLIQEGNVGLLKAIDKYKLEAGTNFSTYATWWIKQACIRLIKSQSRIHIPANIQDKMLRKRKDDQNKELDTETFERLIGISAAPISLDQAAPSRDNEEYSDGLAQALSNDEQLLPDEEIEQKRMRETIEKEIGILDPLVQKVVCMRFGLDGPVMSFTAISETLGINKELVKKFELKGLTALKKSSLLADYDRYN